MEEKRKNYALDDADGARLDGVGLGVDDDEAREDIKAVIEEQQIESLENTEVSDEKKDGRQVNGAEARK